jgi:hypothetical protein
METNPTSDQRTTDPSVLAERQGAGNVGDPSWKADPCPDPHAR